MKLNETKSALAIGFTMVVSLMMLMLFTSLSVMHGNDQRIRVLVDNYSQKIDLLVRMRTAARERTVSLQKMLIMEDPFDRDEEWLRFNQLGGEFVHVRQTLLSLELAIEERRLLNAQGALTRKVAPLQVKAAELILDDQAAAARSLLLDQVMPGQDRTFAVLSELLLHQRDAAFSAVADAEQEFSRAVKMILAAVLGVIIISLLIAVVVIRRSSEAERRLAEEKERAQITLHSIGDAVITTDTQGRIEQINDAACVLTGLSSGQAVRRPIREMFSIVRETSRDVPLDPVSDAMNKGKTIMSAGDLVLILDNGREYAIEHTVSPIFDQQHGVCGAILVLRDVTEMRALTHQLAFQASHDALTGLPNRRELESHLDQALAEARRYPQQQRWLCYIDLDQFKIINDTCGHQAGDELLKQVAADIKRHVRNSDVVARIGGDEFAVLLNHCDATMAEEITGRIRVSLHDLKFAWSDKSFSNSASIGMVPVNRSSGSLFELLSAADSACYIAKDAGRNRVHIHAENDAAMTQREGEMEWVHRINSALQQDRFVLYYQVIRSLQENSDKQHCEVLVRMLDENGEMVPPMAFIPAAERYNLMADIDRVVIDKTLGSMQNTNNKVALEHCSVSINLSAQSLCDDDLLDFILERITRSKVSPDQLCFEITETSAIANLSRAMQFIIALKQHGCRFSLDDFGSGLSSFGYLKNLPVDYLKIDGCFVRDIADDPMDRALVESINQIGHVLGIKTIAEYVENDQILQILKEIGVDYGQGYGISKPQPLEQLQPEQDISATATV